MVSIKSVAVFVSFVIFNSLDAKPVSRRKPWENKNLFEGDIMVRRQITGRSAVSDDKRLWPGGVIYYGIAPSLESYRELIESAMRHIERETCIRFEENVNEISYVLILKDAGCYSHIGRDGIPQPLSLGKGCMDFGTVVHELLHAVGFYHEHTRSDRDDYLEIYWENIDPEYDEQFEKLLPSKNRLINDFDYDSIMMYGELAFSIDDVSPTMKPKKEGIELIEVHNKKGLSENDIERINTLYQCEQQL